ncbi:MAG: formylglycine-generating enzyme family protein [Alkalinema sp. RU_4_3]|nr:formylglycine-generating enzyme family protein [Alkalinema sp. RU_4_3]
MALTLQRYSLSAQYFTENINGVELDMVSIPGGTFKMGSPEMEEDRSDDEGPQRQVTVSPFFMGKYAVTQAQWQMVADRLPKVKIDLDSKPSHFDGDRLPVEQVSWLDAIEFCDRLSRHTGRAYRLPSEAEWEYACRAGTTTAYHFGDAIANELANYGYELKTTTAVGSYGIANRFGLYDMHGNVFEWCQDDWHDNYEGAPIDGSAWVVGDRKKDSRKLLRGGSWYNNPRYCRSAFRRHLSPDYRNNLLGFRVVCVFPAAARTLS